MNILCGQTYVAYIFPAYLCLNTHRIFMLWTCLDAGLYVLASESVQIPWFDSVFADIGDEQSLSQSLSTFSGHLKQISVRKFAVIVLNRT